MKKRHPEWFKIKLPRDTSFYTVRSLLKKKGLHTVCREARCPNRVKCYSQKRITFLIMGDVCTRNCMYCGVSGGRPHPLDPSEIQNIAGVVEVLQSPYLVITSVTRDDLPDYGAGHFAAVVKAVKQKHPSCKVEVLVPDFMGRHECVEKVLEAGPYVFSHNIEVVQSLFSRLRPGGDYSRSLNLLAAAKKMGAFTKSGLMLGFGETSDQLYATCTDLREAGVDALTLGQYLPPGKESPPVHRYYSPAEFNKMQKRCLDMGFRFVFAGPLVRSSSAEIGDIR
jgi:lipoyl synthase